MLNPKTTLLSSLNPLNGFKLNWASVRKPEAVVSSHETRRTISPVPAKSGQAHEVANNQEESLSKSAGVDSELLANSLSPKQLSYSEIKDEATRFYVIVGGFKKVATANKMKRQLMNNGYDHSSIVIPEGKGLVKVSVENFKSSKEAALTARQIGTRFGSSAWVLKQ